MNNIRDTLTNMINLKLPHGGYSGTGLDLQNNKVDKSITITAGKGLTGGGNLSANRTINISNADGSLVIGDDDIKVNIYDGVDSTSTKQAASPASVKKAYDRGSQGIIGINTHTEKKDNPHAVTKEQIGLGEVQNYPVTSAINDASNSKYSTAGATKTAYDKSVEALNDSNTRLKIRGLLDSIIPNENYICQTKSGISGNPPAEGSQTFVLNATTGSGYNGAVSFTYSGKAYLGYKNPSMSIYSWSRLIDMNIANETFSKKIGSTDSEILARRVAGNYCFDSNSNPKFRVANLEIKALNINSDHFQQWMYNYDDLTTYIRNTGQSGSENNVWHAILNTRNVNVFYCPYQIGDILITTRSGNPSGWWNNTGWEKIENRFIYAHNSAGALGGENSHYISTGHMPIHGHGGNYLRKSGKDDVWDARPSTSASANDANYFNSDNAGGGQAINNMPQYYTAYVWKRVS